jgi:hypothetical protein
MFGLERFVLAKGRSFFASARYCETAAASGVPVDRAPACNCVSSIHPAPSLLTIRAPS